MDDAKKAEVSMNSTVLNVDNLKTLHDGFLLLHKVFCDVSSNKGLDVAEVCPTSVLVERMDQLVRTDWGRVKDIFLKESGFISTGTALTETDKNIPSRLLLELLHKMDGIREELDVKLQERFKQDTSSEDDMRKLKGQVYQLSEENLDLRYKCSNLTADVNAIRGTMEHLETSNNEKKEKITQLQRDSTVQLWEKEKQRLFQKYAEREKELEETVARYDRERDYYKDKVVDLESKYKMMKMRDDKGPKPETTETTLELDSAKRHCYVLEKDLVRLDSEMFNQQKYVVGILKGLSGDHDTAVARLTQGNNSVDDITLRQMNRLGKILRQAHQAAAQGTLGSLRADLTDNYVAIDRDIKATPMKKISLKYGVRLSPLPQRNHLDLPSNGTTSTSKGTGKVVTNGNHPGDEQKSKEPPKKESDHPQLVEPKTGWVNMIRVLQNFPHMKKEFVESQWEQFTHYDKNDDGSLDLPEMMVAMTSTLGSQFTAPQVKEAMMEVDVDHSDTIDFFEYLKVADMLRMKQGRSELFRSQLVQSQAKHVSKTCIVM